MAIKKNKSAKKTSVDMALTSGQSELAQRLQDVQSYWTRQYNNVEDDLRFRSGDQWDERIRRSRESKNQPVVTTDFTQNIIQRIVNPIRKNPFGIRVKHKDLKMDELYQGLVRDIEYQSNASEAYETGFDTGVGTGIGYIMVNTDYQDDNSLDQTIRIERVSDPTSIWIDPMTDKIDGSDMRYAMQVKYIAKDQAEAEYDYDEDVYGGVYEQLFRNWIVPDNTVPEMIYWNIVSKKTKRTWLADGTVVDGKVDENIPEEAILGSRTVDKKHVEVIKYVGAKEVSVTKLQTDYIPVIPVYGDPVFDGKWRGYGGIVRLVRDTQTRINLFASNELLLIQTAPIAPWLITAGQIENYEDIWATANSENHDHLPYNETSLNGTPVGPPVRADNAAQTQHLQLAKGGAIEDMQRTTGIFDSSVGRDDVTGQSGVALSLKNNNADISSYHYVDNLTKSITQCGKVVLQLINTLYDTERELTIRAEDGSTQIVKINLSEMGAKYTDFDTEVEAGPMLANEREMQNEVLLEMGRLDPQKFSMLADLLVENMNMSGSSKIVERLRKLLPPELQPKDSNAEAEGKMDPQAEAALQAADQNLTQMQGMLDQYEGIMSNLQTQLLDNEHDRKAKIEAEQIKAETDLAIAELNNATKLEVERIKAGAAAVSDNKQIMVKARENINSQASETIQELEGSVSDIVDVNPEDAMGMTQKVGGPIGPMEGMGEVMDEGVEMVENLDDLLE